MFVASSIIGCQSSRRGLSNSIVKELKINDSIEVRLNFVNGNLNGLLIRNINSAITTSILFNTTYGRAVDTAFTYLSVGTILNYNKDNLIHGKYFLYYNNGVLQERSQSFKGERNGIYEYFQGDGKLLKRKFYIKDKLIEDYPNEVDEEEFNPE